MLFLADAGHANCKKIKGTRRQSSYMPPRNYTVLGHRQFRSRKAAALNKATALWMRANAATARRLFSFAVVRQLDNRLFLFLRIIIKSKCHRNVRAALIFDRKTSWNVTMLGYFINFFEKRRKKQGSTRRPADSIQLLFCSQPFHQSIFLNGSANSIANTNLQSNKQNGE